MFYLLEDDQQLESNHQFHVVQPTSLTFHPIKTGMNIRKLPPTLSLCP